MIKASITGLGMVTPFGSGSRKFWNGLQGKASAETSEACIITPDGEKTLRCFNAKPEGLDEYIPAKMRRRMEPFAQTALLACNLALKDAEISSRENLRIGIVFGTAYGCLNATFNFQDTFIDHGDTCASPLHFSSSVHNSLAAHVSIGLKIQGPTTTVTCFEMTTAQVFQTARIFLESDMVDLVLAGIGEENHDVRKYASAICHSDLDIKPSEAFTCFLIQKNRENPKYGFIGDIHMGSTKPDHNIMKSLDAVITANNSTDAVNVSGIRYFNYSSQYGYMPSNDSLSLATAALSLKHGFLPGNTLLLQAESVLGCSNFSGHCNSLVTLQR
ncbi:MAG: beta-ketoacyl synthase chain length factor [Desulfobacterales bacterium]|nr:beta-ketoacyl synthase chain length factor [Desulfobacterales bacterium]